MKQITVGDLELSYLGPKLADGPLPTIFYFALSAKDTLLIDPYNQPISSIDLTKYRIFSCDLPEHEPPKSPYKAIGEWIAEMQKGEKILEFFFDKIFQAIQELIKKGLIPYNQIGFMGLSRGAFIATHIASRFAEPVSIVGFSPLIQLSQVKEAKEASYYSNHLDLTLLEEKLLQHTIRFYIGNHDTRVGSKVCANFIFDLADKAFISGIKNPKIELQVFPSIGYMGHGTPKAIFEHGCHYLINTLQ